MTFANILVLFYKMCEKMYLHWGRPEAAEGGEVGCGARGKGGSAGGVKGGGN